MDEITTMTQARALEREIVAADKALAEARQAQARADILAHDAQRAVWEAEKLMDELERRHDAIDFEALEVPDAQP